MFSLIFTSLFLLSLTTPQLCSNILWDFIFDLIVPQGKWLWYKNKNTHTHTNSHKRDIQSLYTSIWTLCKQINKQTNDLTIVAHSLSVCQLHSIQLQFQIKVNDIYLRYGCQRQSSEPSQSTSTRYATAVEAKRTETSIWLARVATPPALQNLSRVWESKTKQKKKWIEILVNQFIKNARVCVKGREGDRGAWTENQLIFMKTNLQQWYWNSTLRGVGREWLKRSEGM